MGSTGTAAAAGAEAYGDRRPVSDAAGVVVLGAAAAWSLISASVHGGRPEGVLLAVLAVAAGHSAGRICGALLPVATPCAAALAGLALAAARPYLLPGPQPGGPLGHAGATAALLVLCAGAACCAAWAATGPAARLLLRVLAAAIAVAAAVLGSTAGAVLCAVVLLCSLAAGGARSRGPGLVALGLAAALSAAALWAIAGRALPDGLAVTLESRLTARRIGLWHDALHLAGEDPLLGVGPGRFGELSPVAAGAPLPDGKPHSAPLQQLAEQGAVGLLLLAAAFVWMLYALWRTARPTPVALTAGAALTAVAVVAAVGNALSFTAVSAGAGLLAGLATARPLTGRPPAGAATADG